MKIRVMMALLGYGLVVAGVAILSTPIAMIVAGLGLWLEAERG